MPTPWWHVELSVATEAEAAYVKRLVQASTADEAVKVSARDVERSGFDCLACTEVTRAA